jgi:hypothetical protein
VAVPHIIDPRAVYDLAQAREALGLAKATLGREIRLGRLRVSKRAGKCLILGSWLTEWIVAGEVRRQRGAVTAAADDNGQTEG